MTVEEFITFLTENQGDLGVSLSETDITNIRNAISSVGKLKEIEFGTNITKIGSRFIYVTSRIEKLTLPSTLTEISASAFGETDFESIIIPDSVYTIGSYAFNNGLTINMVKADSTGLTLGEDFYSNHTIVWGYTGS